MRLVGECAEVGINVGNQVLNKNLLESTEVEAEAPGTASRTICSAGRSRARRCFAPGTELFAMTMMKGTALPSAIRLSMIKPA